MVVQVPQLVVVQVPLSLLGPLVCVHIPLELVQLGLKPLPPLLLLEGFPLLDVRGPQKEQSDQVAGLCLGLTR